MAKWLVKSEPAECGIEDFAKAPDGIIPWDGVRNYQARNMMRDAMKEGDLVLFYHSNTKPPHVGGVAKIVREGYPDFTSWDTNSKYFDEKSTPENPRWFMVDIEPITEIEMVSLESMKNNPNLEGMPLLQRGQRLSVQPVTKEQFDEILSMAGLERRELS